MNNKVICIYSVWTNQLGIDKLEKWKEWIYIYENSRQYLEEISVWDIVIFLRTWEKRIFLFEIKKKNQIISQYTSKQEDYQKYNGNSYITMNPNECDEFLISAEEFKNLYFLNFDNLSSWVRSPLATKSNILIFENKNEIIQEFKTIEILRQVFWNIDNYIRQYYFIKNENEKDIYLNWYKNIVTYIENDQFKKEYSHFHQNGITEIQNFNIPFDTLEQKYKSQNKKKLDFIRKNDVSYYTTYPSYYDLTRVDQNNTEKYDILEIADFDKKINKITSAIKVADIEEEKDLRVQKEDLEVQKEEEKSIEQDIWRTLESIKDENEINSHEKYWLIKSNIDIFVENEIKRLNTFSSQEKKRKNIENEINTLLPMIRLSYIYQWGINSEKKFSDTQTIIKNFDVILEKAQKRAQKQKAFQLLFWFFAIETLLLFGIILSVWAEIIQISDTTLQILVWATILQVWSMLTFIVHHLYPQKEEDN